MKELVLFLVYSLLQRSNGLDFRSQVFQSNLQQNIQNALNNVHQQQQLSNNPYEQLAPIQGNVFSSGGANSNPVASFPMTDFFNQSFTGLFSFQSPPTTQNTPVYPQQGYYNQKNVPAIYPSTVSYIKPTVPWTFTTLSSYTTTTTPSVTPLLWTTKATKAPTAKMSKLSVKPLRKEDGVVSAQVSVPSHRLLNDILVIPSSRRLYILAIFPVHESADYKGFECGKVDVNGFGRMAAFLDALSAVNSQKVLQDAGLSLGAVIIDSCSSDLRTVADLYELLSGTNIQKGDLVALIRDDSAYLPNVDEFARHLRIPTINTYFSPVENPLTTGTLPSMASPIEAMFGLFHHTDSKCVSMLHDERHTVPARQLLEMATHRGICIEALVDLKNEGKAAAEGAIRRLLLTEARIVVVLLSEWNWIEIMKAFRSEMVIAGRFIILTPQDSRWFTSKQFQEAWPHFDQLLLSVAVDKVKQQHEQQSLTSQFAKLPFPASWRSQFWSTAFKCHIDGDSKTGQQFSKECEQRQLLNLSAVAPDLDIAPVTIAVHSVAHAVRKLIDHVCPGALVQSLNDCLNDPQDTLFNAILNLRFVHPLGEGGEVFFNGTSGFRDHRLLVNRVIFNTQLEVEKLAEWDTLTGFTYTAGMDLVMEERDGTRVPLRSLCPRSACAAEATKRLQAGNRPAFSDSLTDVFVLIYAIGAVVVFIVCMMCMYHRIVATGIDEYRTCTAYTLAGLSLVCLVSIFFIIPPNPVSCSVRRLALGPSLTVVLAPILIKTLFVWGSELRQVTTTPKFATPIVLFWITTAVVLIQTVISFEWGVFEWPTDMTFVASSQHGMAWRCSPGSAFEHRLLHSCGLNILLIIIGVICSVLSVRRVECRQNLLIMAFCAFIGVALYVSLPFMSFKIRDQVIAGVLLLFSCLIILITYCRAAFEVSDQDSSRGSLMEKSTMDRSAKSQGFWMENRILSPKQANTLTIQRNYHQSATLQQPMTMDRYINAGGVGYAVPPRAQMYGSHNQLNRLTLNFDANGAPAQTRIPMATLQRPPQNNERYGVEGYELPPSPKPPVRSAKYGAQEYVLEEDSSHVRL